jgi:DHA2 family multidrug resistance protein-like MFS transporter
MVPASLATTPTVITAIRTTYDAQGTGLRLLPMIAALIAVAAGSEAFAARIGVKFVIPAGMILSAAGLLVLARAPAHGGYGIVALALAVFGAGLGLGLPLAADAVLGTLAPHQTGTGNALSRTLQSFGVALGAAILGSVLNSTYRNDLTGHLAGLPSAARNAATASIAGARSVAARLPGSAGLRLTRAASSAYTHGMAHAAAVCIGLLVSCAILCLLLLPGKPTTVHDDDPGPGR